MGGLGQNGERLKPIFAEHRKSQKQDKQVGNPEDGGLGKLPARIPVGLASEGSRLQVTRCPAF